MKSTNNVPPNGFDIRSFDEWLRYSHGFMVRLRRDGTLLIPRTFRQQLGLTPESELMAHIDEYRGGIFITCLDRRPTSAAQRTR